MFILPRLEILNHIIFFLENFFFLHSRNLTSLLQEINQQLWT